MKRQAVKMPRHTLQKGFTLIEALIAILLVGVAVAALVGASRSFTMANDVGVDLSTAEFLIEQIRELTTMLPVADPQSGTTTFGAEEAGLANFDDVDDFDGQAFSPPINAERQTLTDFSAFSQQVTVKNVSPSDFTIVVPDHTSNFVAVTVTVLLNSRQISSTSWIRARY